MRLFGESIENDQVMRAVTLSRTISTANEAAARMTMPIQLVAQNRANRARRKTVSNQCPIPEIHGSTLWSHDPSRCRTDLFAKAGICNCSPLKV
jgi:hypothetical protein